MRAFLLACFAIIAVGAGGYFFLDSMQESTGVAFTTDGARINPKWTWRAVFSSADAGGPAVKSTMNIPQAPRELTEDCSARTASQWIFVDLGTPDKESELCKDSQ
jgi:hypothetical protein